MTDNTNVRWLKIFHLYQGFNRKCTVPGFFIKGSARVVEPPRQEYKGFKYKYNIKGDICRLWLVRSNLGNLYKDHTTLHMVGNAGFVIRKRQDPKSKYLNGPINRGLRRRKLLSLFKTVL